MDDNATQVIFLSQKNAARRDKVCATVNADMVCRNLRDRLPPHLTLVDDENLHDMAKHAHTPLLA